jgi:hypothetical protein
VLKNQQELLKGGTSPIVGVSGGEIYYKTRFEFNCTPGNDGMYDWIWFRSQYGFVTTGLGTPTGNQLLSGEVSSNSELARRNVGYY